MVSLSELAEAIWGPEPPATARGTLRNYVKEIRKALGGTAGSRLSTVPGGYEFRVTADELDLARFDALLAEAKTSVRAGAWEDASQQLHAALSLWRGEPLADVPSEWLTAREQPRLAELRLQAVESRIEADLRLGRYEQVIAELRRLTTEHPFRERLHAQLMLALYRDGQQAEALAAYQRARAALLHEIGIEPGPELGLLLQRILSADPALISAEVPGSPAPATPSAATASQSGDALVPHQLPAPVRLFTGRAAELRALTRMLDDSGDAVSVCALTGTAGVGKTSTAIYWAHKVAERFPDGQLYVDLHGYDPADPLPVADALAGFIRALGVAGQDMPADAAQRAALYRSLLSKRSVLILLDNASSVKQVRPLLPGTPGCATLVTSRDALAGLVARDGAERLELGMLPAEDAAALLHALIGTRAETEPQATQELAAECSWLPLALRVAAELAATQPATPLARLVRELADQGTRLDRLDAGGDERTAVRTVLSWSCRYLDAAAARAFRLLGLHPGGGFEPYAVAALTGSATREARRLLEALARAYLIQPTGAGRHTMHDLLRAYAAEQAGRHDTEPDRRAAITRLLDYYLRTAHAAAMLLNPARDPLTLGPPEPGVVTAPMATRDQAISWFEAEQPALQAAIRHAAVGDLGAHAWQLARMLAGFLALRRHQPESIDVMRIALEAAERIGDVPGQAHTLRELGGALLLADRDQEADGYLRRAQRLHQRLGDQVGEGRVHHYLSIARERDGRYPDALRHAQRALALFRAVGHVPGQARALNNVGLYLAHVGEHQRALISCRQAIDLNWEVGDDRGEAAAWDSLGYSHRCLRQDAEAIACYQQAVALYDKADDRSHTAQARARLGDLYNAAGKPRAAREAWQQALDALDELGHPQADAIRSRLSPAS
jgi:DNA-binding SARP family transcriptional activator